jgi:hypothetical protein
MEGHASQWAAHARFRDPVRGCTDLVFEGTIHVNVWGLDDEAEPFQRRTPAQALAGTPSYYRSEDTVTDSALLWTPAGNVPRQVLRHASASRVCNRRDTLRVYTNDPR